MKIGKWIILRITEEDIKTARMAQRQMYSLHPTPLNTMSERCPIAQALKRGGYGVRVNVGGSGDVVIDGKRFTASPHGKTFIATFDDLDPVKPTRIRLTAIW